MIIWNVISDLQLQTHYNDRFLEFVKSYLVSKEAKCSRHCTEAATFVPLVEEKGSLIGAYVCPSGYASRVVYFAERADESWFEKILSEQVGQDRVRSKDIRVATRHGWELGGNAEEEIKEIFPEHKMIKQYYWTSRPKKDERLGIFLCSEEHEGCGKLFTQDLDHPETLCPNCRYQSCEL